MIESVCPNCGETFEADESDIGRPYLCPGCSTECIIPSGRIDPQQRFGHYRVIRPLGAGATSEVHLARHETTGQEVALKILFVDDADDDSDIERFLREAKTAAKLAHPCLIEVYEFGTEGHQHFMAIEYIKGETVESMLEDYGEFSEEDALHIVANVADAMRHAWNTLNLVHRDIKPGNIIVGYDGCTKLMDLGIARSLYDITRLTAPDVVIGSPPYMSPEQCAPNRPIDCRADIYSLGATLFHMVTGHFAFFGKTPVETVRMHLSTPLPDPRQYNPNLRMETASFIKKMMAKSPAHRHTSWDALIAEADQVLSVLH